MTSTPYNYDVPSLSGNPAPVDPSERARRRNAVEKLLLFGWSSTRISVEVAREFGVSSRMVRKDVRRVRQVWQRWEERQGHRRLTLNLRRLDAAFQMAMLEKDHASAGTIAYRQAQLLGYGAANVFIDNRKQTAVFAGGSPGAANGASLERIAECAAELRRMEPRARRRALLEGMEGNGHGESAANGGNGGAHAP